MIHTGSFPSPWAVGPGDLQYSDAQGRAFAVTCHITPGMGAEVIALTRDASGGWVFATYLDDYVDGHWSEQGQDMTKYLTWLAAKLTAWLAKTFPAGWAPAAAPAPADPGKGEPIERVHAALGLIKITSNADGTLSAHL